MISWASDGKGIAWDDPDRKSWAVGVWWSDEIGGMFMSYKRKVSYRVLVWPEFRVDRFRDWHGPNKPVGGLGFKKTLWGKDK
jgi:hypothetical protein